MPLFPLVRDAATAEFLDGCERGELLIVRDRETGAFLDPKTDVSADPERYERVAASGEATVVSWSIGHGRGADGAPTDWLFGIVQLAEGPWFWSQLELGGDRPTAELTGARARVGFVRTGPEPEHATIPFFVVD
ncbi:MAG: OB-fold domain-containing protein [Herbiconiux sp.]|nr:OB-fold domain-containing protein [Herbiconiux sp.]